MLFFLVLKWRRLACHWALVTAHLLSCTVFFSVTMPQSLRLPFSLLSRRQRLHLLILRGPYSALCFSCAPYTPTTFYRSYIALGFVALDHLLQICAALLRKCV